MHQTDQSTKAIFLKNRPSELASADAISSGHISDDLADVLVTQGSQLPCFLGALEGALCDASASGSRAMSCGPGAMAL